MTSSHSLRVFALAALAPLGIAVSALAQPTAVRDGFVLSARYSHTADSDLATSASPASSVTIDSYQLGLRANTSLTDTTSLLYGLEWSRHELDLSGPRWLPGSLKALAAPLGVSHAFNDRWRLLATVSPRLAGAGGDLGSAGFDLPVLVFANYTTSPELTWTFGLRYGARSDIKILPIAGVVWKFAPEWEFRLAWPDTGLSYRATPALTLRAVAAFHGGDYRLKDDPRAPADRTGTSLSGSWLEYREVRIGLAAEYAIGRGISLRADLGKVVFQRFEYLKRDLKLDGGTPIYFALGVVARF
jgi:hypothetical protein